MENIGNISIENAKLIFATNFSGVQKQFNPEGDRNFNIIIPEDIVEKLRADGWSIKETKSRDDDGNPTFHYMKVSVKYPVNYPALCPKIYMVTRTNKTLLDEQTVGTLDNAEIKNIDLIIRPRVYDVNGKTGIKAYVKSMYVTIEEDQFADKYNFEANDESF